jgi:hypothetical protein
VLVVEFVPEAREGLEVESLRLYVERMNGMCHGTVRLDMGMIIIARDERPFERTEKRSVFRMQSLETYREEIDALEG